MDKRFMTKVAEQLLKKKAEAEVVEETLSDGSKVYNVVVPEFNLKLDCDSEQSAIEVQALFNSNKIVSADLLLRQ